MAGLGDYVRRKRDDLGLTQAGLSESVGATQAAISDIERGRIKLPNADIRRRLAKALGVSHLDLLVAAGEITREELGTVEGKVERDPDDPRKTLADRIRDARLDESDLRMFNLMLDNLDAKTGRDREGRGG